MMIQDLILKLQFLPLTLFLAIARFYNFTDTGWKYAFIVSSLLALLQTLYLLSKRVLLDRFLLAVNLFLYGGALAFITHWSHLLTFYERYQHIVLFICLVLVGFITTFFDRHGFIGISSDKLRTIKLQSIKLLSASLVSLVVLILINIHSLILAAILFVLLKLFQTYLIRQLQ